MSLRLRVILGYILLLAGSFSFIIYLISQDIRPRYLESVEDSMVDTAELMAALLAGQSEAGRLRLENITAAMKAVAGRNPGARIYEAEKRTVDLRVSVTDARGVLLYDSSGESTPGADFSRWRDVARTLRGEYGARSTRRNPQDPTSSVLYVAAPILQNGKIIGVVTVGKPQDSVSFFITLAKRKFLSALLLTGFSAVVLGVIISHWITRPMRRLIQYVRSVQRGKPERLPALGTAEIGVLGAALGEMQAKLEGKTYIEDYVRALTHEMKSPLTGIKGAAEILREEVTGPQGQKFLGNIDSEVERLHHLIDRTLQLSRLENLPAVTKKPIEAEVFLRQLVDAFQTQLREKRLHLNLENPPQISFAGDALLLRQALGNLLINAVDFSPPDTTITLTAAVTEQTLVISVRDQGTGIPDFAQDKVFDKFFSLSRPDTGKKSTGLGLPFVREVLLLHGGRLELENTHPGLEARLILPLHSADGVRAGR